MRNLCATGESIEADAPRRVDQRCLSTRVASNNVHDIIHDEPEARGSETTVCRLSSLSVLFFIYHECPTAKLTDKVLKPGSANPLTLGVIGAPARFCQHTCTRPLIFLDYSRESIPNLSPLPPRFFPLTYFHENPRFSFGMS